MEFRKVLGFWDIFWLGIGGMVGVAILTFPSLTYQQAGPASLVSWILAGVFSLLMAVVYSEMVTAFPRSGALVVFPYEAFGKKKIARYLAFLEGVGYYIGTVFGIVISAIILGDYLGPQFSSGIGQFAIAEVALVAVGIINLMGVKLTSKINLAMSVFFIAIFAAIIILGIAGGSTTLLHPFLQSGGITGIVLAIPVAILAYGSWTALLTVPEETINVKKVPKAIFWSIVFVTVFYVLLVLAVYLNLGASQMQTQYSQDPVLGLVASLGSPAAMIAFQMAAVLSIVAVMLVMVLSNARILYALTRLDFLPKKMNRMSGASVPLYATLLSLFVPMALSAFPGYYFQYVVIGAIIGTGLPRLIDLASYFRIRRKSHYKPAFRVRHGTVIAAVAFVGLVVSELSLGASDILWSAAALIALTAVFYLADRRR